MLTSEAPDIRVMLMLANSLDCDAISVLFSGRQHIAAIETSSDLNVGMVKCEHFFPHVLIIDPRMGANVIPSAVEALQQRFVHHVIVLDDRLYEGRLAAILKIPTMSYVTRQAGFAALLAATIRVGRQGERVFDPSISDRVQRTPKGWRLDQVHGRPSVADLTKRELEVAKLLAVGSSVSDCAKSLHLAESTVDNHKSRLMKKLRVHKASALTHLAIRDGLIPV